MKTAQQNCQHATARTGIHTHTHTHAAACREPPCDHKEFQNTAATAALKIQPLESQTG